MQIAVYGASGHTARFVIAELLRRGHQPIAIAREQSRLVQAAAVHNAPFENRVARLDSPDALARALAGADAVINCAGPFLDTAQPLIEAALHARVHYFDLTAEQASARATFDSFDAPARERGIVIAPAAGFYGGFADILASDAMSAWTRADSIEVAVALDSWQPTLGTRRTGQRNTAPRIVLRGGEFTPLPPSKPARWSFPEPFGIQDVVELPFTETILMPRHLSVLDIRNYLNEAPLRDLRNSATPEPRPADERGRSNQRFLVEVVVRNGDDERCVTAQGRDIYAITAPIVVEAVERACRDMLRGGALALGELGDAADFLAALVRADDIVLQRAVRNTKLESHERHLPGM